MQMMNHKPASKNPKQEAFNEAWTMLQYLNELTSKFNSLLEFS